MPSHCSSVYPPRPMVETQFRDYALSSAICHAAAFATHDWQCVGQDEWGCRRHGVIFAIAGGPATDGSDIWAVAINRDPVLDDKGRIKTFFTLENAQTFVEALENLIGALNALEAAAMVDKDGSTPETLNAAKGLCAALQDMAELGVSKDGLQYVLNAWTDATGGPRVTLRP